jgi:predicted flap endonuclease-1-like 5' DNA nuclease
MTELTSFLTSLYDSFSEAEMQALQHGQMRLAELLESGTVPDDVSVPVYHASEIEVTLDVGLVAEETKHGTEVFVTDADDADASQLTFTVDLFELLEKKDLEELDDGVVSKYRGVASRSVAEATVDAETHIRDREDESHEDTDVDRSAVVTESIDVVEDIGPEHREVLEAVGVERLTDLVELSPSELSEAIEREDVEVSPARSAAWIDEARGLIALLSEGEENLPVELVDGIGPTFGTRLRDAGIADLPTLVDRSPEEVAELATSDSVSVSTDRAGRWIEEATTKLRALEEAKTMRTEMDADESGGETDTTEDGND